MWGVLGFWSSVLGVCVSGFGRVGVGSGVGVVSVVAGRSGVGLVPVLVKMWHAHIAAWAHLNCPRLSRPCGLVGDLFAGRFIFGPGPANCCVAIGMGPLCRPMPCLYSVR